MQEKSNCESKNISMARKSDGAIKREGFWGRVVTAFKTDDINEIARKTGVGYHGVRKWSKDLVPGLPNLITICDVTGSSMDWLLTGDESKKASTTQPEPATSKGGRLLQEHSLAEIVTYFLERIDRIEAKMPETIKTEALKTVEAPPIGDANQKSSEMAMTVSKRFNTSLAIIYRIATNNIEGIEPQLVKDVRGALNITGTEPIDDMRVNGNR